MTILRIKSGAGGTWEEVGGIGIGVPAGGTTGQVLVKTSAADYATAWSSTPPVLANNTYLQGYKADGTTAQALIGMGSDNNLYVAPSAGAIVSIGYNAAGEIRLGPSAQNDIHIGMSLAAGKNIYVPRLTVQGTLTLADQQFVQSSTGYQIISPWSPAGRVDFAINCPAQFNVTSGYTTFARDINANGSIYKGGVAYTHPDFVFEHHYTGGITQFLGAHGATEYRGLPSLDAVEAHTRETLRLPGARGDKYDLFARGDELLAEVERTYLYLFDHEHRIAALEKKLAAQHSGMTGTAS
jgi:hypothetical protein